MKKREVPKYWLPGGFILEGFIFGGLFLRFQFRGVGGGGDPDCYDVFQSLFCKNFQRCDLTLVYSVYSHFSIETPRVENPMHVICNLKHHVRIIKYRFNLKQKHSKFFVVETFSKEHQIQLKTSMQIREVSRRNGHLSFIAFGWTLRSYYFMQKKIGQGCTSKWKNKHSTEFPSYHVVVCSLESISESGT